MTSGCTLGNRKCAETKKLPFIPFNHGISHCSHKGLQGIASSLVADICGLGDLIYEFCFVYHSLLFELCGVAVQH